MLSFYFEKEKLLFDKIQQVVNLLLIQAFDNYSDFQYITFLSHTLKPLGNFVIHANANLCINIYVCL